MLIARALGRRRNHLQEQRNDQQSGNHGSDYHMRPLFFVPVTCLHLCTRNSRCLSIVLGGKNFRGGTWLAWRAPFPSSAFHRSYVSL